MALPATVACGGQACYGVCMNTPMNRDVERRLEAVNVPEEQVILAFPSMPNKAAFQRTAADALAIIALRKLFLATTIILLTASCARRATMTPAYLTIHANDAACDMLPMTSTGRTIGECRYTVETDKSVKFRRIEFRRVR